MNTSLLYLGPVDPANWVGLQKSDDLLGYIRVSRGTHQSADTRRTASIEGGTSGGILDSTVTNLGNTF